MTRESTQKGRFRCVVESLRLVVTLLLLMVVGVCDVKAAFTEGLYYIKSNSNTAFYLCPSIGCYYGNNIDQPHLTTFKTAGDQNSIWKIVPVENETDTYYIIHYKTGRYLKSNEDFTTDNGNKHNRKAVHLEVKPETLTDDFKFLIKNASSPYQIYPKSYYTDASGMSFNPTSGHKECYAPADGGVQGMIGLYGNDDAASKWQIPAVTSASIPCATPIIKYEGGNITISYPYSDETGITIYYTTDGTDPATSETRSSYSSPISTSGVIKVRAIATKEGLVNSDEAILWGSARPFLIQSKQCADYYFVPSGNNINVCTTSIPGTSMQWTLRDAGTSPGGVPYYYLVNNNNKRIKYTFSNNKHSITMDEGSADANKFCVVENGYNTGNFFLIPISQTDKVIYKVNGNVASDHCNAGVNKNWNTNLDQWIFRVCNASADQKDLFSGSPFNVSDNENTHYYHIANKGTEVNGYYLVPPADADGYAMASNIEADYNDNPWIFKEAASDNWQTYYYIINAASGKYMYFNPDNYQTENQENVISLKDVSEKNAENEEKFQFIMVRSTTTGACYIVSKGYSYADTSHRNFYNNTYFGLWLPDANNVILKTTWSRSSTANNVKWAFEPATFDGAWADPVVTCDLDGNITITNGEDGAEFYYTINSGTTLPATPTATESETNYKYNSSSKPTADVGFTTIKVRAIADGKQKSNVVKKTIIYNPTIALTAESYTYNGLVQNPVSSVSIGGNTIASSEYEVKYQKEGEDTELTEVKDAGTYTILVKDVDGGDYIVYGKNTTVTISPAALTVTADAKTKVYGDADPALTYTSTGHIGTDAFTGDLSRAEGENAGTYAINQGTLTAGSNYIIAYTGANLTITAKSIGDGTTPATDIVINIDGDNNITVTRTTPTSHSLTQNTDFTVSGPTEEEGNQIWTITGINNYDGGAKVMRIGLTFNETEIATGSNVHDVTPYKASVDMTIDGLDAYIVTHINMTKRKVTIKKINYVKKDEPLLLLTDLPGAVSNFTATPKHVEEGDVADTSDNLLKVSSAGGQTVGFGEVYMYYQGKFVMTTGGTLPEGKFYLDNPNPPSSSGGGGTSNAPLRIVIDDTMGMEDVRSKMEDERKGYWYTLDGRRLSGKPAQKGLYIMNRQKIVVK